MATGDCAGPPRRVKLRVKLSANIQRIDYTTHKCTFTGAFSALFIMIHPTSKEKMFDVTTLQHNYNANDVAQINQATEEVYKCSMEALNFKLKESHTKKRRRTSLKLRSDSSYMLSTFSLDSNCIVIVFLLERGNNFLINSLKWTTKLNNFSFFSIMMMRYNKFAMFILLCIVENCWLFQNSIAKSGGIAFRCIFNTKAYYYYYYYFGNVVLVSEFILVC